MKRKDLGSIENARTPAQTAHMQATIGQGKCPFCDIDFSKNKPLGEWKHWWVWQNPFPYPFHIHHLVIPPKRHVTSLEELTGDEMLEWLKIVKWAEKHFNMPGGALVMRFGDPKHNAGTIAHLHWQIQVPDGKHSAIAVFSKGPALGEAIGLLVSEK
jgi:diadenosine tetraphosphate (Ap4A) HIT family hydrolase